MATLILTGLPGVGKTTIGRLLSKKLGYNFIDLDNFIQQYYGIVIAQFINKNGIKAFRVLEQHALKQILKNSSKNTVLALGGGTFCNLYNQKLCLLFGTVIWLNISVSIIEKHYLKANDMHARPILKRYSLNQLYEQRKNSYNKSNIVLTYHNKTSNKTIVNDAITSLNYTTSSKHIALNASTKTDIFFNNFVFSNKLGEYFYKNHYTSIVLIIDNKLCTSYLNQIINQLTNHHITVHTIYISAEEKHKSLNVTNKILKNITKLAISKNTAILSVGGGVIEDISGLCSNLLLRGLPLFHVPTTLLAMVDSSIGGKNAVNTQYAKNVIGTIYQPKAVFIDYVWLQTLPKYQIESGYYECLKYGILFSTELFNYITINKNALLSLNYPVIEHIITNSVKLKCLVIEKDEFEEKEIRYLLNLGHTLGHALETYTNYKKLSHGQAVAIGIYFIAKLSNFLGFLQQKEMNTIVNSIDIVSLKAILPKKINIKQIMQLMLKDKKNTNGTINLVLIQSIENCFFKKNVNSATIQNLLTNEL